ncbi:type II secretion system protein GspM [Photobacterium lutimaris]|uniref:MSHA biogenesis protein MshJ n=1 Tax=Photobacterium lutimaris TaxID=388278 RepID=A0A2T3IWF8_9GAMM|nr:type II secretion system protein GspM [Photobacterium lutimaris]PSU32781.1 MSHA biogenesis protein MshJ [Photobacterium lutimaris]TDR74396.1 MSHA biogenesis protein MshJ [Photobacterium lutimaris]
MNQWQRLCDKFELLTKREKWLIAVSGWIALLFVGFVAIIEPQVKAIDAAKGQLQSVKNALVTNTNQLLVMERKLKGDPDADIDEQISELERQNTDLDTQLDGRVSSLVTPVQMSALMEQVLQHSRKLKLLSLESLPPVQLVGGEDQGYFIHPVRLTLRGRYFDLIRYLEQLEALPVQYYWRSMDYQVDNYPWADIKLEVYTLGISEDFIGG